MNTSNKINPHDLFSAKDLVVVITGGATGIGFAFAAACAGSSARKVYVLGRRLPALQEATSQLDLKIVSAIQCDVTDLASIQAAAKQIKEEVGYVDVLINNAGVEGPHQTDIYTTSTIESLQEIMLRDPSAWDTAYRTNTVAPVLVAGAFLLLLDAANTRRGWVQGKRTVQQRAENAQDYDASDNRTSQIITISSISAFNRQVTVGFAYTATKAGAVQLGKTMAHFLAPWGIRSNVICPGRFPSEMTAGAPTVFPVNQVPAGKVGEYEDLAGAILYLVGKAGAYQNGNVQVLDGGRLSVMPGTY